MGEKMKMVEVLPLKLYLYNFKESSFLQIIFCPFSCTAAEHYVPSMRKLKREGDKNILV